MQGGAETQEKPRTRKQLTQTKLQATRRGFKTLQSVATDKENLTGRPTKSSTIKSKDLIDHKTDKDKKFIHKGIQTGADIKFNIDELTSDAGPSENYWQIVAERRRVALEDALKENQTLHEKVEVLEEEIERLREMVDESKSLVDVLSEIISEQESGIDLAEASTSSVLEDDNPKENEATAKD